MNKYEGTKTEKNLLAAFAGESQATTVPWPPAGGCLPSKKNESPFSRRLKGLLIHITPTRI